MSPHLVLENYNKWIWVILKFFLVALDCLLLISTALDTRSYKHCIDASLCILSLLPSAHPLEGRNCLIRANYTSYPSPSPKLVFAKSLQKEWLCQIFRSHWSKVHELCFQVDMDSNCDLHHVIIRVSRASDRLICLHSFPSKRWRWTLRVRMALEMIKWVIGFH